MLSNASLHVLLTMHVCGGSATPEQIAAFGHHSSVAGVIQKLRRGMQVGVFFRDSDGRYRPTRAALSEFLGCFKAAGLIKQQPKPPPEKSNAIPNVPGFVPNLDREND